MAKGDMFDSCTRSAGDRTGVFEYDGETGYFYLYDTKGEDKRKVIAAIRVLSDVPDFEESDVAIRWDATDTKVGLFIRGQLWAAFDSHSGTKYGGDYRRGVPPQVPTEIGGSFESR